MSHIRPALAVRGLKTGQFLKKPKSKKFIFFVRGLVVLMLVPVSVLVPVSMLVPVLVLVLVLASYV